MCVLKIKKYFALPNVTIIIIIFEQLKKNAFWQNIYIVLSSILNSNFSFNDILNIGLNHSKVMDDFCKTYDLTYNDCMKDSTYLNLEWWGDKISGRDLKGVNKNFAIIFNEKIFYKRDIKFLEYILNDYILFYGYKFTEKTSKFFFNFLPMKCEIIVWANIIRHKKILSILSIPFFYLKRLLFVNKLWQKKLKMPYSLGGKF